MVSETPDDEGSGGRVIAGEKMWIGTWLDAAEQRNVSHAVRVRGAEILKEALKRKIPTALIESYSSRTQERYEVSLTNFIETQMPDQLDLGDIHTRKSLYWLGLCVAASADRMDVNEGGAPSPEATRKLPAPTLERVVAAARERFRDELSAQERERWSKEIDRALDAYRRRVHERVREYQRDILCPAFRGHEPDPRAAKSTVKWLTRTAHFPRGEEPRWRPVSREERFRQRLKSFFESGLVNNTIFDMFLFDIRGKLKFNKLWGYMDWGAQSIFGRKNDTELPTWPLKAGIVPHDSMNREKGWSFGKAPSPSPEGAKRP